MKKSKTLKERFWGKADTTGGQDACWPWQRGNNKYGVGSFNVNGRPTPARRFSYELSYGPIQPGLEIRANPDCKFACVNPAHLSALTKSESSRRKKKPQTTEELFWEKVDTSGGPDACWLWQRGSNKYGIGSFNVNGKPTAARRVSYELSYGPILPGLVVTTFPDCKSTCVNPIHLKALTKSESVSISGKHQLTHCKKGHLFTKENTDHKGGKRYCVVCRIDWLKAEIAELANGPSPEPEDGQPDREPVYPELWGNRPRVVGGREVDEKFERRFWRKVDLIGAATACWPWKQNCARDPGGYGLFDILGNRGNRKRTQAHIVAYQLEVGPIPNGLVIDHFHCGNKSCCNPAHLEPVTQAENSRRASYRKPYCERGHPHNEENSYFTSNGTRYCRACRYLADVSRLERLQQGLGTNRNAPREERFWRMVDQSGGPGAHWLWQGKIVDASGYGYFSDQKKFRVHRLAWEFANGQPIPEGQTIDHKCRIKLCCNTDHLEPVSVEENSRRAAPFRVYHKKTTEERFWAQADTSGGPDDCWPWKADSMVLWDSEGEKSVNARHFIYQLKVAPVPLGKWILGRCGNPSCVNYRHLTRAPGATT